jgi:phosphotriesterase-related protein
VTAQVQTVLGPVDADQLGFVLPHEHLVAGHTGWHLDIAERRSRDELVAICVADVEAAKQAGVGTIIDVGPADLGRDVAVQQEVSRRTGVHVLCATGLYSRRVTPYFANRTPDELAELFVHELTVGIGSTGARAALVKVAVEAAEPTPYERRALEAAALAHEQTGAPVMCHAEPGATLVAARLLRELGVAGNKLVVAHAESATDLADLLEVVEDLGAYVGFDRFGLGAYGRDDVRVALVGALCAMGLAHRVLLSHDHVSLMLGREGERIVALAAASPDHVLTHVPTRVVPALAAAGVTADQLTRMTVGNPVELLTAVAVPGAPPDRRHRAHLAF